MEKILEKSGKSQGILSIRKNGNPAFVMVTVTELVGVDEPLRLVHTK